jgi:signal transduction histidine kinase
MVRELMVFARRRPHAPQRRATNLEEVAARALSMCRSSFDPRIDLRFESSRPLPCVLADAGRVEQALLNVLWNARDALQEQGSAAPCIRLTLDTSELPGEPPAPSRAALRIRVSDNGPGLSEAMRSRVFEPFFTTKLAQHGTGLGLATVYGTMVDHGGVIVCESELGAGATFSMLFPITDTA